MVKSAMKEKEEVQGGGVKVGVWQFLIWGQDRPY